MASVLANRVKFSTSTTDTGTLAVGAAVSNAFCTPAEAGVSNGDVVSYAIEDGADFEVGRGTYSSTGPALSRDTVLLSKISGTAGTSKLTLSGAATVFLTAAAEDIDDKQDAATALTQGKHTIWVPAAAMIARTGSPALNTTTMSSIPYQTMDFDPSSTESACFTVAMPKSWNAGTVTFVPVWSHPSTTTNFGVEWWIRGNAISDGDGGGVTPGGQVSSIDTGGTADTIYQGSESSACTIQDTPAANDIVWFEVFRNTGGDSDTLAVDARLHGVKLFYTVDAGDDS